MTECWNCNRQTDPHTTGDLKFCGHCGSLIGGDLSESDHDCRHRVLSEGHYETRGYDVAAENYDRIVHVVLGRCDEPQMVECPLCGDERPWMISEKLGQIICDNSDCGAHIDVIDHDELAQARRHKTTQQTEQATLQPLQLDE